MSNQLKTVLLLGLLTGILLGLGFLIGGRTGLTIAFIISLAINFVTYWFSGNIALFMYRAKEADKDKHKKLYSLVNEVSKKAGIPMPKVYFINKEYANAFATGRNPNNSYVVFTQGILNFLNEDELKGVIAHELSHIKNRDILVASVAAVIAGTISYIAMIGRFSILFGGRDDNNGSILGSLLLLILTPIIAMFIQLAISRTREYIADSSAARILNNSKGLASALYKLEHSDKREFSGNVAGASLFIVNPLSGKMLLNLFSTHPPMEERINRLNNLNLD